MHTPDEMNTPARAPLSPGYQKLQMLAIGMGAVLVIGLVVLFAGMAKQLKSTSSAACDPVQIKVSAQEKIVRLEERENSISMWLQDPEGAVVVRHYDLCSGTVIRDVRLSGGMPAQQQAAAPKVPVPAQAPVAAPR